jgi:acyl dehydratase
MMTSRNREPDTTHDGRGEPVGLRRLGQGFHWQDLHEGDEFKTFRWTVTETDLVAFIGVTGMLEEMFIDAGCTVGAAARGRLIPAALTYSLIEGFILQSMIQGTGLAMLSVSMDAHAPVFVGDTIEAVVRVTAIQPTPSGRSAIVDSTVRVINQADTEVLTYTICRLLAGRSEPL